MEFRKLIIAAAVGTGIAFTPMAFAANTDKTDQSVGEYVTDAALTTKVKAAIMADKQLSVLDISVETTEGVATLTGKVGTKAEVDHATTVAQGVDGIKHVKNELQVDPAKKDDNKAQPMTNTAPAAPVAPMDGKK